MNINYYKNEYCNSILIKNWIKENDFTLKDVISYTTRNIRSNETEGVEHYFITPEVAKEKLNTENILAYTKIGEIEYFATVEALNDSNLYIIDPLGIEYLKKNNPDLNTKVIYIYTDLEIRKSRCSDRSDFATKFEQRNIAEDEQFTKFEKDQSFDIMILNNESFEQSVYKMINFILNTAYHHKDTLFLVAARTGSGKDSLINACKEIINNIKES